jgi:hypothetical protein
MQNGTCRTGVARRYSRHAHDENDDGDEGGNKIRKDRVSLTVQGMGRPWSRVLVVPLTHGRRGIFERR